MIPLPHPTIQQEEEEDWIPKQSKSPRLLFAMHPFIQEGFALNTLSSRTIYIQNVLPVDFVVEEEEDEEDDDDDDSSSSPIDDDVDDNEDDCGIMFGDCFCNKLDDDDVEIMIKS